MTIHRVFAIVFSSGKRKEINNLQKWAMTLLSRLGEFCCAVDQGYKCVAFLVTLFWHLLMSESDWGFNMDLFCDRLTLMILTLSMVHIIDSI